MPFGESTDRNFVGMVQMKLNSERAVFVVKSTKASSNKEIGQVDEALDSR